jgi:hypothetical protein
MVYLIGRDTTNTILLNVLIPCNVNFYEKDTYHWCSWILGSHLCDRFIKEGYFVIVDNLITGDLKNIEHLFKLENFEFYHHDITKFVHVPGQLDYLAFCLTSKSYRLFKNSNSNTKSGFSWNA